MDVEKLAIQRCEMDGESAPTVIATMAKDFKWLLSLMRCERCKKELFCALHKQGCWGCIHIEERE